MAAGRVNSGDEQWSIVRLQRLHGRLLGCDRPCGIERELGLRLLNERHAPGRGVKAGGDEIPGGRRDVLWARGVRSTWNGRNPRSKRDWRAHFLDVSSRRSEPRREMSVV